MATIEDVRRIALKLPGAYEQASHGGAPSFRTKPRGFGWLRAEPESLALHVASEEDKFALIAARPDIYFTIAHYDGYAMVLVRLDVIDTDELAEMITDSWRLRAPVSLVRRFDAADADVWSNSRR